MTIIGKGGAMVSKPKELRKFVRVTFVEDGPEKHETVRLLDLKKGDVFCAYEPDGECVSADGAELFEAQADAYVDDDLGAVVPYVPYDPSLLSEEPYTL